MDAVLISLGFVSLTVIGLCVGKSVYLLLKTREKDSGRKVLLQIIDYVMLFGLSTLLFHLQLKH